MTLIQSCKCPCRKQTSEDLSGSLPPLDSNHNNSVDPIMNLLKSLIAKYIKKNQQKILKTVLKAQVSPFKRPRKKMLNARLSDVYCSKSHIEY